MTDTESRIREASSRYTALRNALNETDHAVPGLKEQTRFIADLKSQVSQTDRQIKDLDTKRESELKDHEKYRDSSMRRYLYKATGKSDRFAEKAAKEEKEYYAVLQEAQQAKTIRESLEVQMQDALQVQRELEAEVKRNENAKTELAWLYEGIFAGPTPNFPEEDAKEEAVNEALGAFYEARSQLETENHLVMLLTGAFKNITQAQAHIEYALRHSRMDMFGGGGFSDMMERQQLAQAEMAVRSAKLQINRARQANPGIPQMPPININHGNIISDVLFDNIWTDMAFHQEIKRGQQEVWRFAQALGAQANEAKARQQSWANDVKRKEEDLGRKRMELQREREAAFERYAGGNEGGDLPPAYEAAPAGGSQGPAAETVSPPPPFATSKPETNPFV